MPTQPVIDSVEFQRDSCRHLSSPFYSELLACALSDAASGVPFWDAMDRWQGNPMSALLPLRMLGALHDLVLAGRAPALAASYPSPGFAGDPVTAWAELNAVIRREETFIDARLDAQVQTNEVRRCLALLPGFLLISERSGLPLRLAEIGASAGLNLCWDRYRYRLGDMTWGDPEAPITLDAEWSGPLPNFGPVTVTSRQGCDISPLDMRDEADRRRLQSFVWPDQHERLDLLRRAIDAAAAQPLDLIRKSAGDFVEQVLADRVEGEVTVIYHSIMWIYVPEPERKRITAAIETAGRYACVEAPLAWLRMEFADGEKAGLWLDYWPNPAGPASEHVREHLAECHYHGTSIRWLGAGTPLPDQPVE